MQVVTLPSMMVMAIAAPVWGQDLLPVPRLRGPIVIDGRADETEWDRIPILPMTVITPQYRSEPTERTEIRVAYDDEFFYVSGRMYDSDAASVRANTLYRDAYAGDDLFSIALDTYNDYQTASWFVVNPGGGRIDQTLANDGERTDLPPYNLDWDTYWSAETSRDETG